MQLYLLEGLARWNADRAREALQPEAYNPDLVCYEMSLKDSLNSLSQDVLGRPIVTDYKAPGKYTGMCKY